jgi:hypothetical protein
MANDQARKGIAAAELPACGPGAGVLPSSCGTAEKFIAEIRQAAARV